MLVDFYQLTNTPLEKVLPRICERLMENGDRLLIVADSQLLLRLDTMLWTQGKESFLPHGLSSGASPENQPILLSEAAVPLNDARNVALADGMWRDEALAFERCFFFFDAERTEGARHAWRGLGSAEGVERRYWRQEAGKWVQGP